MANFQNYFTQKTAVIAPSWTSNNIGVTWAGDLNGDGKYDLILTGASYPDNGAVAQQGYVVFGDGFGNFTTAPENIFPNSTLKTVGPSKILSTDFNGDGNKDIFVASLGYDIIPGPGEQNKLYLSQSNGSWKEATANLPQLLDFSHSASFGDINSDGYADIYVNNCFNATKILPYILKNDGSGTFSIMNNGLPNGSNQLLDIYKTNNQFTTSSIRDLNNDGKNDLVLGSIGGEYITNGSVVLWNSGNGFDQNNATFLPKGHQSSADFTTVDSATMDINNDGYFDLIFLSTLRNPYYQGAFIDVYINQGNKTFVNKTDQIIGPNAYRNTGGWSQTLDIIDANKDNLPDIVMSKYWAMGADNESLALLLNKGNGTFLSVKYGDLTSNSKNMSFNATPIITENGLSFISSSYSANDKGSLTANELISTKLLPKFAYGTAEADFQGIHTQYKVSSSANTITVTDSIANRDTPQTLLDIQQRLKFSDGVLAFDIQNTPDNALTYRLYQAAFARTPDEGGLRFWIDTHNKGVSINDIGSAFLNSAEFKQKYGADSTNSQLVDLLYKNILGREGEAGGVKYWNGVLDSGQSTKEQVLIGFAGSPENVAKTAANIDNGYWLV